MHARPPFVGDGLFDFEILARRVSSSASREGTWLVRGEGEMRRAGMLRQKGDCLRRKVALALITGIDKIREIARGWQRRLVV